MWYLIRFIVLLIVVVSAVSIGLLSCTITADNAWGEEWWIMLAPIGSLVLFFWFADANDYRHGIFAPAPTKKKH